MSLQPKEVLFGDSARAFLKSSIDRVVNKIKPSLGSRKQKEGITKALSVEDAGTYLLKQMILKIQEETGDGISTFLVLSQKILEESYSALKLGYNPVAITKSLDLACSKCLKELDCLNLPLKTKNEITDIATIIASPNSLIGKMIAEAIKKAGKKGKILLEESNRYDTYISCLEGIKIPGGYQSCYFVTDKKKMCVEITNPKILIYDQKIENPLQILPLLQSFIGKDIPLVIVSNGIMHEALSTLSVNHLKKIIQVCPIKFSSKNKKLLKDLAQYTNTFIFSEKKGMQLKDITFDHLGSCEKFIAHHDNASFINSKKKGKGKIVTIHVGAYSESELIYKKQCFQACLEVMQTSISGGITVGGGTAYYQISKRLSEDPVGERILKSSLRSVTEQIIKNAGCIPPDVFKKIDKSPNYFGFNNQTLTVENLFNIGIFDQIKTLKTSLFYAISVTKTCILTETIIKKGKKK